MTELMHGGDLYGLPAGTLDFSSNSNPLGLPEGVKTALADSIGEWDRYPDPLCRELTGAIARAEGVPPAQVICGNGAADLLFRAAAALRPRRALVPAPTFAEYARALEAAECEVSLHPMREKDGFALTEAVLKQLSPALDLLVLCNPNNPTGQPVEPELMERILKRCAEYKIRVLVDECFLPFLDEPETYSLAGRLSEFPQVLVLKAFTKLYAMAGLRLGYLLSADPETAARIGDCGQPWSVSAPAQTAGLAALKETDYLARTKALIPAEREFLSEGLRAVGMTVIGSKANYLFFKCHNRRDLRDALIKRGILLRSCENFAGLDGRFYRAAVRTRPENEQLLRALADEIKGES